MKTIALIITMVFVSLITQAQTQPKGQQTIITADYMARLTTMENRRKTGNKIIIIGMATALVGGGIAYIADQKGNNGVRNGGYAVAAGGITVSFVGILKK